MTGAVGPSGAGTGRANLGWYRRSVPMRVLVASARRVARPLVLLGVALLLTGCAAGANPAAGDAAAAGFGLGLWHGLIAPVAFVISLFTTDVGIYEVHNAGTLYDLGFVIGLGFLVGGGASGARSGGG